MENTQERRRLNWQQACAILGCGKSYFYNLVATGQLTGYRVGQRGLWVYEDDCKRLLRSTARKRKTKNGR